MFKHVVGFVGFVGNALKSKAEKEREALEALEELQDAALKGLFHCKYSEINENVMKLESLLNSSNPSEDMENILNRNEEKLYLYAYVDFHEELVKYIAAHHATGGTISAVMLKLEARVKSYSNDSSLVDSVPILVRAPVSAATLIAKAVPTLVPDLPVGSSKKKPATLDAFSLPAQTSRVGKADSAKFNLMDRLKKNSTSKALQKKIDLPLAPASARVAAPVRSVTFDSLLCEKYFLQNELMNAQDSATLFRLFEQASAERNKQEPNKKHFYDEFFLNLPDHFKRVSVLESNERLFPVEDVEEESAPRGVAPVAASVSVSAALLLSMGEAKEEAGSRSTSLTGMDTDTGSESDVDSFPSSSHLEPQRDKAYHDKMTESRLRLREGKLRALKNGKINKLLQDIKNKSSDFEENTEVGVGSHITGKKTVLSILAPTLIGQKKPDSTLLTQIPEALLAFEIDSERHFFRGKDHKTSTRLLCDRFVELSCDEGAKSRYKKFMPILEQVNKQLAAMPASDNFPEKIDLTGLRTNLINCILGRVVDVLPEPTFKKSGCFSFFCGTSDVEKLRADVNLRTYAFKQPHLLSLRA
ncbi:MAG: hypothetical protein NTV32_01960 [Gammaproteobacteria bacterium]|nr:hypothetical protein [Gammaproteobacteria bacterium]